MQFEKVADSTFGPVYEVTPEDGGILIARPENENAPQILDSLKVIPREALDIDSIRSDGEFEVGPGTVIRAEIEGADGHGYIDIVGKVSETQPIPHAA
jgi:hypothetical protein